MSDFYAEYTNSQLVYQDKVLADATCLPQGNTEEVHKAVAMQLPKQTQLPKHCFPTLRPNEMNLEVETQIYKKIHLSQILFTDCVFVGQNKLYSTALK